MIVVIGDKHYPHVNIEDLSLGHVMALQRELTLTNISSAKTWADVRQLVAEYAATPEGEQPDHPEYLFLTCLVVWAARVTAGEQISLLDAVDVPVSQIKFIAEPHDKLPGPEGKAKAPTASVRGGAHQRRGGGKKKGRRISGNPSNRA